MSWATINLGEYKMEHTNIEVETKCEEERGADLDSPLIVRKRQKWSSTGPRKK